MAIRQPIGQQNPSIGPNTSNSIPNSASTNDPLKTVPTPVAKELATLTETVASVGRELNALRAIQLFDGPSVEPNELLLRDLWIKVYLSILTLIYGKGLAYWNNKPKNLMNELELAVIRADEAVECYIRVRNSVPDPVTIAAARYAREQMNKPL